MVLAITDEGQTYVVTDNDSVDDWSGETWFLQLGQIKRLYHEAAHPNASVTGNLQQGAFTAPRLEKTKGRPQ